MRHLKGLLLVAFMSICFVAQAQKVAHVNFQRVIANMPETRALQTEIAKISKTYKDDIDGMKNKYVAKLKKYDAEAKTQTDAVNAQRGQEIQEDRAKISQAEQVAYQEIENKNTKELATIEQKILKALKEITKARGIQYVLDSSPRPGGIQGYNFKALLVFDGDDLYNALKVKLGLLPDQKPPQNPNAK